MMANPNSVTVLERLLSDTFALMVQTQGVHWNFTGGDFFEIHDRSRADYEALFAALDEVAERLKSIGATAPASIAWFGKSTSLPETHGLAGKAMIEALAKSHTTMAESLSVALRAGGLDPGTEDLLVARLRAHEMSSWMWGAVAGGERPQAATTPPMPAPAANPAQPAVSKKKSKKNKAKAKDKPGRRESKEAAVAKPADVAKRVSPRVAKTVQPPVRKVAETAAPPQAKDVAPVKVERSRSGRLIRIVKDTG